MSKKKFSKKQIGKTENYKNKSSFASVFSAGNIIRTIVVLLCVFVVVVFGKMGIHYIQSFMGIITDGTVETISKQVGTPMQTDEFGNVNVLLVGHGGGSHAGGYLADTIIVASWNPDLESLTMLSVPRDLYVNVQEPRIVGKINSVFAAAYLRFKDFGDVEDEDLQHKMKMDYAAHILAAKVGEITDLEIPYYAIIDFEHFTELIDHLGGVFVDVPEGIYDRSYPGPNNSYQTFKISAGPQLLDGETALKYARSRHTTSDFSRSHRQQLIIQAVLDTIMQKENITNVTKVKQLFDDYSQMVTTNITNKEIIGMIQYKDALANIFSFNFTTECVLGNYQLTNPACFLYTPSQDAFNGASVILPNGGTSYNVSFYDYTQNFAFLVTHKQGYLIENPRIAIYNAIDSAYARQVGQQATGHAGKLATKLKKYAFTVVAIDSAEESSEKTIVLISGTGSYPETIELLDNYFINIDQVLTGQILETGVDMKLIIGNSYLDSLVGTKFSYDKFK